MDGMLSSWAVFDQKATMINVVFKEDILSCELSLAGECLKNHSCNFLQIVTHILQKAFFRHSLGEKLRFFLLITQPFKG